MMGCQSEVQKKLFYTNFKLDRRVCKDHILHKIDQRINFDFIYHQVQDTCGSKGNLSVRPPVILKKRNYRKKRKHYEYAASKKVCSRCLLKEKCTRSKSRRTFKRHVRQDDIDQMLTQTRSAEAKADIKTRQHLMERSFARVKRYGYKRARRRRLWRVQIQESLTASIQNIMVLLGNSKELVAAGARIKTKHRYQKASKPLQEQFFYLAQQMTERQVS